MEGFPRYVAAGREKFFSTVFFPAEIFSELVSASRAFSTSGCSGPTSCASEFRPLLHCPDAA